MAAALLLAIAGGPGAPAVLQVSTSQGVSRITLRNDPAHGLLVPHAPLALAVGGKVGHDDRWAMMTTEAASYRFLVGAPIVSDGNDLRPLPAATLIRNDTTWVSLAFVADVLADPARRLWTWQPGQALLSEGPPVSQMVSRPAPVGTANAARPAAIELRAGHVVTIDAGHGGTDPGNSGAAFPSGLKEKDITLAMSLLVRDDLQRAGVRVVMTRTTDTLINLAHRAPRYCRDDCDLFVSLHVNSLPRKPGWTSVRGFETYFEAEARTADAARVAQMENEAIRYEVPDTSAELKGLAFILKDLQSNEYLRESARAAELMQDSLAVVHDGRNRGVKQAGFMVLNTSRRPAILVEMGFGTNGEDARLMTSYSGQRKLARAISDAIISYLKEHDRKTWRASN